MSSLDIKDVIHFYIGSECMTTIEDVIFKITGVEHTKYGEHVVNTESVNLSAKCYGSSRIDTFCTIKPILNRLEDMTDEQQKEFCIMKYGEDGISAYRLKLAFQFGDYSPEQTVWLFKNSFDLFSLIDRGLAIDKKTLVL